MTDQATQDAPTYADHRPAVARAAIAQPVSAERVPLTDEAAPVATDARSMLEFLSARFKHAGVSEAVAESYARDIDAILAAEAGITEHVPLTESRILDLLSEHTTYDLQTGEEPPLVEDNYGSRRYASRFIDFARAIERAHGITAKVAP